MTRYSPLLMENKALDALPAPVVPAGYTLRAYRHGDAAALATVYAACRLGCDTAELVLDRLVFRGWFVPERMVIAEKHAQIAGTATAWRDAGDPGAGYLRMLGVRPQDRGRGLGRVLVLTAVALTRDEGFAAQRLYTDDWRQTAIRLYLELGYRPLYADRTHPARWRTIAAELDCPGILAGARATR